MTIIKEFTVKASGSTWSDTNMLLAFEPNGDKVWIKEKAHDPTTLAPYYTTVEPSGLTDRLRVGSHYLAHATMLSKYPMATSALDNATNLTMLHAYMRSNTKYNLDKNSQAGNVIEFTSTQGVKHHLIWYQYPTTYTGGTTTLSSDNRFVTRYTLIEGDDWTNPVASVTGAFTGAVASGLLTGVGINQLTPVYVDTANKLIYCHQVHTQGISVGGTETGYTRGHSMCKIPFTTRLDGALAISSASGSGFGNGTNIYTTQSLDTNPIYFCGKNNDGTPMFLTQIENDTTVTGSNAGITASFPQITYYPSKTLWTGVKTNSAPKIYFDKLVGGVQTNVASINLSSNQFSSTGASKSMCSFAPSKFESSTASGETDISYSYSLCFNTSSVPSIIYYRWDKATPGASANLCSIDWGSVTPADKIPFPFPSALAISDSKPQYTTAHCFVTTLGDNRYLNVIFTYGYSGVTSTRAAAGSLAMTTFQIDTSTWQSLTYLGSIPVSAYSFCSLDSGNTRIAVITTGAMKVYTCTAGTWTESSSEAGAIAVVARDYEDRLWAIDVGNASLTSNTLRSPQSTYYDTVSSYYEATIKIILHTSSLTNLVTAEFVTRSQSFGGSNLSNNVKVNAYNTSSQRIATTVYLKLVGSNAVFTDNSSTSISITTSSSADTLVPVTLTGSGLVSVTASFSL